MKKNTVFASLSMMHKAMLVGQIVFSAVMSLLVQQKLLLPVLGNNEKMVQVVALAFAAVAVFLGNRLFRKKLEVINDNRTADAKTKLNQYRSACTAQWALLEASILLTGICLLLTANYAFLALATVLIVYFGMLIPVKARIAAQLNLQTSDLDEL